MLRAAHGELSPRSGSRCDGSSGVERGTWLQSGNGAKVWEG